MKPFGGGDGAILKSGSDIKPTECLHYALNLPTGVVITSIDSQRALDQAFEAAKTFKEPRLAGRRFPETPRGGAEERRINDCNGGRAEVFRRFDARIISRRKRRNASALSLMLAKSAFQLDIPVQIVAPALVQVVGREGAAVLL
jgi:hypothetical protein